MRRTKEIPAAREHFGETSRPSLELSFPHVILVMRYQKLSLRARLNLARITQEPYKRIIICNSTSLPSVSRFSSSSIVT